MERLSPEAIRYRILEEVERSDGVILDPASFDPYNRLMRGFEPLPMPPPSLSEILKQKLTKGVQDLQERAVLTFLGPFVDHPRRHPH
jgi:hypothetical protein